MSDDADPKKEILVPSGNRELTTRSSALVRRGLNDLRAVDISLDVTPLSLRVETEEGLTIVVIERNTIIPVQKSMTFSTTYDMQRSIEIHLLMGQFLIARENASLARLTVEDISPAPRGMHQIEVTFNIDANGILRVTAKDVVTQKEQSVRIKEASPGLSEEEINKMLKDTDAQTHKTGPKNHE